jgi:Uncharacterized protein conserved in bacteria
MSASLQEQLTQLNEELIGLYQQGRYQQAVVVATKACLFAGQTLGKAHPVYATFVDFLARLYYSMGDFATAGSLYQQALEIRRTALGENSPDFAGSLYNVAVLYKSMSNYAAAEPLYRQALRIRRAAFGENHPAVAQSLSSLALLYFSMGNYAAAEPLYQKVLEIDRRILGEDHVDYARDLNNLAMLYRSTGNYAAAESLYVRALAIIGKAEGEEHPDYAFALDNLASLYATVGRYADAMPLCRKALEISRRTLGERHPEIALSLNNLAALYQSMGNYAEAESLSLQGLAINSQALGEAHPLFGATVTNLAMLYVAMGNYAVAEPFFHRALEILRRTVGEEHPGVARTLNNLALLSVATHREDEALALMQQAAAITDRMIGQIFSTGSEGQRMAYMEAIEGHFYAFLSLVVNHLSADAGAVRAAADLVLRRKAIGAEALAEQRDAVLGGKYPDLATNLKELNLLRMQIGQKTVAGPGAEGLEAHRNRLAEWNARKEQLEAELARQIPEMNLEQKLSKASREVVALALPEDSVLVEFVRFHVFNFAAVLARGDQQWKPPHYLAFVLRAGEPDNVRMIDLGEADPIDTMIATFRTGITGEAESRGAPESETVSGTASAQDSLDLRTALFDPLTPAFGGRTRLLLAPDGNLARLPFEVLPTAGGRRVIDEYHISYLGAGRDILRFRTPANGQPSEPLVIADPDFDLAGDASGPSAPPSRQSRELDLQTMHFSRLPGTRVEGERIATMLGVPAWFEGAALETRLKDRKSPRILHLATHGFFLPDQKRDLERAAGLRDIGSALENPLLRSGLALAGANTARRQGSLPPEAEDGILTAEDVSGMDLLDTELVVLSACETGLGQVRTGEGVFGLRRSFVLAGARGLVMSLWKVPDEQTQELMEDFYKRILDDRLIQSRAEALRVAQLALKERYPDPGYWGAFIYQGDPFPAHQDKS